MNVCGRVAVLGVLMASLLAGGCGSLGTVASDTSKLRAATGDADLVLVAMHADWCGVCRRLMPKVQEASVQRADRGVTLVKADLTDRVNPGGRALLESLGLEDLWDDNDGKTGIVYIVDTRTGKVVGRITGGGRSTESIVAEIDEALEGKMG